MSLGTSRFPESYCRTHVGMEAAEHEVSMILADMHNQPMQQDQENGLYLLEEPFDETTMICNMVDDINKRKFARRKDASTYNMEMKPLQEPEVQAMIPQLGSPKALMPASTIENRKCSRGKAPALASKESRPSYSRTVKKLPKSIGDTNKKTYTLRMRFSQAPTTYRSSHLAPVHSQNSRVKSALSLPIMVAEQSIPSASEPFEPKRLLTLRATPIIPRTLLPGIGTPSKIKSPISMSFPVPTKPSPKETLPITPPSTPPNASNPAPALTVSSSTGTWPGHTYPEMITKAIQESPHGKLHVRDLYSAVARYDPSVITRIETRIGKNALKLKKGAQKPAMQIFQENIRQNLSRKIFRRTEEDGAGFWELVNAVTPATSKESPPPKTKRKRTEDCLDGPSKKAKSVKN